MRRLLIAGLALSAVTVATATSQPAVADTEGCYMVTSTADARRSPPTAPSGTCKITLAEG
jgi:uncharacterized membrane protein